jgi:hypothetical protein
MVVPTPTANRERAQKCLGTSSISVSYNSSNIAVTRDVKYICSRTISLRRLGVIVVRHLFPFVGLQGFMKLAQALHALQILKVLYGLS